MWTQVASHTLDGAAGGIVLVSAARAASHVASMDVVINLFMA
jgi:hypothetical protein